MQNLTQILALFSPQNLKSYKYSQELSDTGIDGRGKKRKSQRHASTDSPEKSTAAFDKE
jgi:hypothetical protein